MKLNYKVLVSNKQTRTKTQTYRVSQLKSLKRDTPKDKHTRFKTYTIANSRELLSESSKVETKTIYYLNLDPGIIICIALLDDSANYKVTKENCLDHIINCKMH